MTTAFRQELQERDEQIIKLNNTGLGMSTIAELLNCHPTTITHRLKKLNVEPIDTRRGFMEDIISKLTYEEQEWLLEILTEKEMNIKEFITKLIKQKYHSIQEAKNVE